MTKAARNIARKELSYCFITDAMPSTGAHMMARITTVETRRPSSQQENMDEQGARQTGCEKKSLVESSQKSSQVKSRKEKARELGSVLDHGRTKTWTRQLVAMPSAPSHRLSLDFTPTDRRSRFVGTSRRPSTWSWTQGPTHAAKDPRAAHTAPAHAPPRRAPAHTDHCSRVSSRSLVSLVSLVSLPPAPP